MLSFISRLHNDDNDGNDGDGDNDDNGGVQVKQPGGRHRGKKSSCATTILTGTTLTSAENKFYPRLKILKIFVQEGRSQAALQRRGSLR